MEDIRRRGGREFALHLLYQMEVRHEDLAQVLPAVLELLKPTAEDRAFAVRLAEGVVANREAIDGHLEAAARNWDPARLALLDRCILRMGAADLMLFPEDPVQVILNESIELAKSYSTEKSGRFVNGVLDSIAKTIRQGGPTGDAT